MITATKHLVLLPGLDGTGLLFQPFVEQCLEAEQVTIISYPDNYHIPYSELADFVASQLPKDKDIVLLGESYSGPVAIQLANRRELNISSLILVATFSHYPDSLLKFVSLWLPYKYLLKLPIPDFILKFVCFDKHVNSRIMGLLKTTLGLTPTAIMAKRMSEGVHIDVRDELKAISIPCTYIRAKHDKLVSRSASEEIKKINNSVDIIEIDGPHFILQTRILECYAVIKTIIK
ncbi:MAG: alpha/beta fold hydrolase [Gammaproteobacteria bacterium]